MKYHIVEARHLRGHTLWLKFRDGTAGEIDLTNELNGPMLEPLRDVAFFQRFSIHPEFRTLVWPNGADIAPEFLHDNIKVVA